MFVHLLKGLKVVCSEGVQQGK